MGVLHLFRSVFATFVRGEPAYASPKTITLSPIHHDVTPHPAAFLGGGVCVFRGRLLHLCLRVLARAADDVVALEETTSTRSQLARLNRSSDYDTA